MFHWSVPEWTICLELGLVAMKSISAAVARPSEHSRVGKMSRAHSIADVAHRSIPDWTRHPRVAVKSAGAAVAHRSIPDWARRAVRSYRSVNLW